MASYQTLKHKYFSLLLLIVTILLHCNKKKKHKRWANRRWHVRPINQKRKDQGEYYNLFKELERSKDDSMFFEYTRMSMRHFEKLLHFLSPSLTKKNHRALNAEQKLIIALRYIITGNSTSSISFSFRIGQSTVRNIINEVCKKLPNIISPLYVSPPLEEEWKLIATGYWNEWQMPNCFGALDGKHVRIRCPPKSGSCFFNYKKYFSIVLMAISDHQYKFRLVDIGSYGGNSDGGIFQSSLMGQKLQNEELNLPKGDAILPHFNIALPGFFLADAAFPLTQRIVKPYGGINLTIAQKVFNYRHSRARRTIESAFGILTNRWQIFHRPICMLPKTIDRIIMTSVCLHNFILTEEQRWHEKIQ
ncbi:uncharacterized protein [Prorops nasuta]|uniref:uncharacterized protein n=1 Tax=Prorops nasuta TaxID=863751 RepID=UPI0034CEFA5C